MAIANCQFRTTLTIQAYGKNVEKFSAIIKSYTRILRLMYLHDMLLDYPNKFFSCRSRALHLGYFETSVFAQFDQFNNMVQFVENYPGHGTGMVGTPTTIKKPNGANVEFFGSHWAYSFVAQSSCQTTVDGHFYTSISTNEPIRYISIHITAEQQRRWPERGRHHHGFVTHLCAPKQRSFVALTSATMGVMRTTNEQFRIVPMVFQRPDKLSRMSLVSARSCFQRLGEPLDACATLPMAFKVSRVAKMTRRY